MEMVWWHRAADLARLELITVDLHLADIVRPRAGGDSLWLRWSTPRLRRRVAVARKAIRVAKHQVVSAEGEVDAPAAVGISMRRTRGERERCAQWRTGVGPAVAGVDSATRRSFVEVQAAERRCVKWGREA